MESTESPEILDRIQGERSREPIDLLVTPEGLMLQVEGGEPTPLPSRRVGLRLELLRTHLELDGPEGSERLRFSVQDAARVEGAARQVAEPGALDFDYSLAGFLSRELRVLLSEEDAEELIRAAVPHAELRDLTPLISTRRRMAGWACAWGIAIPGALSAAVFWRVLQPDPSHPIAWAIGSLLAFAGFNLLSTVGLYVQGATQGAAYRLLRHPGLPPD